MWKAILDNDDEGNLIRKSGIIAIVLEGGAVKVGVAIDVQLPQKPYSKLEPV